MIEGEGHAAEPDAVDVLGDGNEDDELRWWSFASLADPRGLAVAALVLAAISLFDIGAGHEIASAFAESGHSPVHSLAIIDGIQAGVAALAVGLGLYVVREEWDVEEAAWAGGVARGAIVVGALAFVIDVVGLCFALALNVHPHTGTLTPSPVPTPAPPTPVP
ncbi:MAG TPA: hypothetical protein VNG13_13255 [Mycobacteriales bacterium]|nr:hypothetical protein [Mycobacteriales bacterium]